MLQIEQDVDGLLPTANSNWLVAEDGPQGRDPLLAVQQQLVRCKGTTGLGDVEVARGGVLVRLPCQDRTGWVTAVPRVNQVPDSGRAPDVATLHLGKTQFSAAHHVDKLPNGRIYLGHTASQAATVSADACAESLVVERCQLSPGRPRPVGWAILACLQLGVNDRLKPGGFEAGRSPS